MRALPTKARRLRVEGKDHRLSFFQGKNVDRDYPLLVAIVEEGSLSAAGRRLKLSAPMVSKRLARLEERLGARLIQRSTRRLALTDVGQAFYERIAALLVQAREAEAMVAGRVGQVSGLLRLSAPTSFGRLHVAPHLKAFLDLHPAVQLELDLSDSYVNLLGERIDLAIRIGGLPEKGLASEIVAPNHRVICAAPDYLARHGRPETIADLADRSLLAADGQLPWRLEGPEGAVQVTGHSAVRTNSSEVVRELALAGAGIALRSTWDVGPMLADGRLVRVLDAYRGAAGVAIHAVRPAAAHVPPAVTAFVAFLKERLAYL